MTTSEAPVRGAVQLTAVTKRFGAMTAVDHVDLVVRPAEFLSLLGPSGCGKTTTLRMLAGFEQPDDGSIRISGAEVAGVPPHKRDVNTVFQQYALFPHMSVWDNVAFGPRSRKVPAATLARQVDEMLSIVRLADFAKRRPAQLSGGQQQRVALARALVNRPSVLLLDEPLGALDLKLRQAMQLELKRIQRDVGITFVFVTHDQEEALTMSDRIAVMNQGRIEQLGTPQEIYDEPASVFVAGFIGSANLLPATVVGTSDGVVRARLRAGADITVSADHARFAHGGAVTAMVRPERLQLMTDEPPTTERLDATVTEAIFQGASSKIIAKTTDGTEMIAVLEADDARVRPGDRVWITWSPGCIYLLPEETAIIGATTDVDEVEASL
jgi:spermidine/putrescine transport system ATP-binding protein